MGFISPNNIFSPNNVFSVILNFVQFFFSYSYKVSTVQPCSSMLLRFSLLCFPDIFSLIEVLWQPASSKCICVIFSIGCDDS